MLYSFNGKLHYIRSFGSKDSYCNNNIYCDNNICNISKNALVHRRYPSGHSEKILSSRHIFTVFNFRKKGLTTRRALKIKFFFQSFRKLSDKSVLEFPCCEILGLQFTTCNFAVKFRLVA